MAGENGVVEAPPPAPREGDFALIAIPGGVADWIEALPLANLDETTRRLENALQIVTTIQTWEPHRFKTLEQLAAPLHYVTRSLKTHYTRSALPLPPKGVHSATQTSLLYRAMAQGYQATVDALLLAPLKRGQNNALAMALSRTLFYWGEALLANYQAYQFDLSPIWRAIHQTYRRAESNARHLIPIKQPHYPHATTSRVVDTYSRLLLLALVSPPRLTPQEMAWVYGWLAKGASACRLSPITGISPPRWSSAFAVELDGEAPPSSLDHGERDYSESDWLALDTTGVLEQIRRELSQSRDDITHPAALDTSAEQEQTVPLPPDLLRRLLAAWDNPAKRLFARAPRNSSTLVAFGLTASHTALGGERPAGSIDTPPLFRGTDRRRQPRPPSTQPHPCLLRDESACGACLVYKGDNTPKVRVGDLVAVCHVVENASAWHVAAIRWLRHSENGGVAFGLQMLPPGAQPIALSLEEKENGARAPLRGLWLPALKTASHIQPPTLLAPAMLYRPGDEVSVTHDGEKHRFRLESVLESTSVYTRFQYMPLGVTGEEYTFKS